MKPFRISLLILAVLVLPTLASAQTPTGYAFVQNGVGLNDTGSLVDGLGPMQFTIDALTNGTIGWPFSNSSCSDTIVSATHSSGGSSQRDVYTFTFDNNQTVILTENSSTSATYTETGTCPLPQPTKVGNKTNPALNQFTLTSYQPLEPGPIFPFWFFGTIYTVDFDQVTYNGSNGTLGSANLSINTNSDGTLSVEGFLSGFHGSTACFNSSTLFTSSTQEAQSYNADFMSGDTAEIVVDDGKGNVVGFVLSATDANGNLLTGNQAWPKYAYFTYIVLEGACANQQGTDSLGHTVTSGGLVAPPTSHGPVRRLDMGRGKLLFERK